MIATIRALTGRRRGTTSATAPTRPAPAVRDLKEEALRVFRTPRGQPEVAGVDHPPRLQGRAGAGGDGRLPVRLRRHRRRRGRLDVRAGWPQRTRWTRRCRTFFARSNPWALRDIAERLLEAANRGMWASPTAATLDAAASDRYLARRWRRWKAARRPSQACPCAIVRSDRCGGIPSAPSSARSG